MVLYNSGSSCSFSLSKFQHNISVQSIGIPYLNMRVHGKTLTGDFPIIHLCVHDSLPIVRCP